MTTMAGLNYEQSRIAHEKRMEAIQLEHEERMQRIDREHAQRMAELDRELAQHKKEYRKLKAQGIRDEILGFIMGLIIAAIPLGFQAFLANLFFSRMTIQIPKTLGRMLRAKLDEEYERTKVGIERGEKFHADDEIMAMMRKDLAHILALKKMLRKGYLKLAWPDGLYVYWIKRKYRKSGSVPGDIRAFHMLTEQKAIVTVNGQGQRELTIV
jgi:hypothetical protein